MTTADIIYEQAKNLPEAQAKEVLNFLECLQAKLKAQAASMQKSGDRASKTLPSFGMWAGRQDISGTNEYLRNLRKPRSPERFSFSGY
jgi:hypothetical protein